jgi:hypothetical protein
MGRTAGRNLLMGRSIGNHRILVFALFALIFILSQFPMLLNEGREVFPFASWSLFSSPPHTVENYTVKVLKYDGETLGMPCLYHQCEFLRSRRRGTWGYFLVQELGRSTERAGSDGDFQVRRRFEEAMFRDLIGESYYQIIKRKYSPQELLNTGTVKEEVILAELSVSGGANGLLRPKSEQ